MCVLMGFWRRVQPLTFSLPTGGGAGMPPRHPGSARTVDDDTRHPRKRARGETPTGCSVCLVADDTLTSPGTGVTIVGSPSVIVQHLRDNNHTKKSLDQLVPSALVAEVRAALTEDDIKVFLDTFNVDAVTGVPGLNEDAWQVAHVTPAMTSLFRKLCEGGLIRGESFEFSDTHQRHYLVVRMLAMPCVSSRVIPSPVTQDPANPAARSSPDFTLFKRTGRVLDVYSVVAIIQLKVGNLTPGAIGTTIPALQSVARASPEESVAPCLMVSNTSSWFMGVSFHDGDLRLTEQAAPALDPTSDEFVLHLGAFLVHATRTCRVVAFDDTNYVRGRLLHSGKAGRPSVYRTYLPGGEGQPFVAKDFPPGPDAFELFQREKAALVASKGIPDVVEMVESRPYGLIILKPFCQEVTVVHWPDLAVIVQALKKLHSRGWTHNDIRPPNILSRGDAGLLLSDLGHATKKHEVLAEMSVWVTWRGRRVNPAQWVEKSGSEAEEAAWRDRCRQDLDAVVSVGYWLARSSAFPQSECEDGGG